MNFVFWKLVCLCKNQQKQSHVVISKVRRICFTWAANVSAFHAKKFYVTEIQYWWCLKSVFSEELEYSLMIQTHLFLLSSPQFKPIFNPIKVSTSLLSTFTSSSSPNFFLKFIIYFILPSLPHFPFISTFPCSLSSCPATFQSYIISSLLIPPPSLSHSCISRLKLQVWVGRQIFLRLSTRKNLRQQLPQSGSNGETDKVEKRPNKLHREEESEMEECR